MEMRADTCANRDNRLNFLRSSHSFPFPYKKALQWDCPIRRDFSALFLRRVAKYPQTSSYRYFDSRVYVPRVFYYIIPCRKHAPRFLHERNCRNVGNKTALFLYASSVAKSSFQNSWILNWSLARECCKNCWRIINRVCGILIDGERPVAIKLFNLSAKLFPYAHAMLFVKKNKNKKKTSICSSRVNRVFGVAFRILEISTPLIIASTINSLSRVLFPQFWCG